MKQIFSKSVYISFLMGLLLGAVIVFLIKPSTANKQEIPKLELKVNNLADAEKLKDFLNERAEDNKIFQLNVSICYSLYDDDNAEKNDFITKLGKLSQFKYAKDNIEVAYPIVVTTDNAWFKLTYADVSDDVIYDGGIQFYDNYAFPENAVSFYSSAYTDGECDDLGVDIDSYFILKNKSSGRLAVLVEALAEFDAISKKEIELSNN